MLNQIQKACVVVAVLFLLALVTLHNPIGGYQHRPYSRAQFAQFLKSQDPVYKDWPDDYLVDEAVRKYPEWRNLVEEAFPIGFLHATSHKALFVWIDEPLELLGFVIPIVVAGICWVWIFRERRSSRQPQVPASPQAT